MEKKTPYMELAGAINHIDFDDRNSPEYLSKIVKSIYDGFPITGMEVACIIRTAYQAGQRSKKEQK